jgi:hypothetical protein
MKDIMFLLTLTNSWIIRIEFGVYFPQDQRMRIARLSGRIRCNHRVSHFRVALHAGFAFMQVDVAVKCHGI